MYRDAGGGRRRGGSSGLLMRWLAVPQMGGKRPLHCAAQGGHVPAIMVMLAAGADKEARDAVRLPACAQERGCLFWSRVFPCLVTCKVLLGLCLGLSGTRRYHQQPVAA